MKILISIIILLFCGYSITKSQNNTLSTFNTAINYYTGATKKDYKKAFKLLKEIDLSNQKSLSAENKVRLEEMLYDCYKNGLGTKINIENAIWHKKIAQEVAYAVGLCYFYGIKSTNYNGRIWKSEDSITNYKKAAYYFQKGEKLGIDDKTPFYEIGICYLFGDGGIKDIDKAIEYFKKADEIEKRVWKSTGYSEAAIVLGMIYRNGIGVPANKDEANRWCPKEYYYSSFMQKWKVLLANHGDAKSIYELKTEENKKAHEAWLNSSVGSKFTNSKDITSSEIDILKMTSNQGCIHAMFNLGECYEHGYGGTKKDFQKAFDYYFKSSDGGLAEASLYLGQCFLYGKKQTKDYKKAFELIKKASYPRYTYWYWTPYYAKEYLAECYLFGKGIKQDKDSAFCISLNILKEMSKQDSLQKHDQHNYVKQMPRASYVLAECYYNGYGITQNYDKAFNFAIQATRGFYKVPEAYNLLSKCYRFGRGTSKNLKQADFYLEEAAKNNDANAEDIISKLEKMR